MKYLHTMVRITDPDASLAFFCDALGLTLLKRYDNEAEGVRYAHFLGALARSNPHAHERHRR